jgi:hypothetical protein
MKKLYQSIFDIESDFEDKFHENLESLENAAKVTPQVLSLLPNKERNLLKEVQRTIINFFNQSVTPTNVNSVLADGSRLFDLPVNDVRQLLKG